MSQFTKTIFLHIKINQFFPEVKGFHSQDSHKNLNFKSKYKLLREVDIIYICLTKLARKFFSGPFSNSIYVNGEGSTIFCFGISAPKFEILSIPYCFCSYILTC